MKGISSAFSRSAPWWDCRDRL